jgi:hypothetical protein
MKYLIALLCGICLTTAYAQDDARMPNGKLQADELLKYDHELNLRDATELARLSAEVRDDLEKSDARVVSVKMLKKLDDLDKLTRSIRSRLKRN